MADVRTLLCIDSSPGIGGATRVLFTALSALDPRRFRALVACNPGPVADEARALGHDVAPVPLPLLTFAGGPAGVARMPLRWARGAHAIDRLLRDARPCAAYVHGLAAALFASAPARLRSVPLVWHVQDVFDARARMRPFVWAAASAARSIVCVSDAAAERLADLGAPAGRALTVHNALPLPFSRTAGGTPRAPAEPATIVAVGALTPAKGHGVLVEAIGRLVRSRPGTTAAILGEPLNPGDEAHAERLRRRIDELGLAGHVRLLGFRPDAAEWIRAASVVVHPSTCEESFGLVALEAMAAGRPVVASRVGALGEVVSDGGSGLLVAPGDADALAGAIAALLDDAALRERMGAEGRRIAAERFTLGRMTAGLNDAFARAIGERPFVEPPPGS